MSSIDADYKAFVGQHAFQQLRLHDGAVWKYYEVGPPTATPLICLHGTSGTAHGFMRQLLGLSDEGYRVLAVGYPEVWTHREWADSFAKFLAAKDIRAAHLYGVSLGGFLALVFARYYPEKVLSLALTNALCDTSAFEENAPLPVAAYAYMPGFLLRDFVLEGFPRENAYPAGIADAIDFQMMQLETLSQAELASRVTLNLTEGESMQVRRPRCLALEDESVTMIDPLDRVTLPSALRDQLYGCFPAAKMALLKSGGDFAHIARHEEVNMHLIVHLRRAGQRALQGQTSAETHHIA